MRALLSQIDRGYVDTLDANDGQTELPPLRDELLATVNARRRRSRAATWTLSAAVAVAIGVFVSVQSNPMAMMPAPLPTQASALEMTPTKPAPLSATVTLTRRAWGTRIEMQCTYEAGPMDLDYDGAQASDTLVMVAVGATAAAPSWPPGRRKSGCRHPWVAAPRCLSTKSLRCKSFPPMPAPCCSSATSNPW